MKTLKFFTFSLMGLILFSCSNDDDAPKVPEGKATKVEVSITSKYLKAAGDVSALEALESTVNDLTVLMFNNGTMDGYVINKSLEDGKVVIDNATSGTRNIYVIANAPAETFTSSMTEAQAKEIVMTLSSDQTASTLVMAGQELNKELIVTETPSENAIEVSVSRLASRVTLTNLTFDFEDPATTSFEISDVYMRNVNTAYNIAGNAAKALVNTTDDGTYSGWGETYPLEPEAKPYFYVGANPLSKEAEDWSAATQLVIKGTFTQNGNTDADPTYYTIWINRELGSTITGDGEAGTGINPNTLYNLSVTIRKKGTEGPGEEQYPAACEITVDVANWKSVNQSTEFGDDD